MGWGRFAERVLTLSSSPPSLPPAPYSKYNEHDEHENKHDHMTLPLPKLTLSAAAALTPPQSPRIPPASTDINSKMAAPKPTAQFSNSGQPLSQLAWNCQLSTGFNDFTPEQKYFRKVRPDSAHDASCGNVLAWQ